MPDMDCDHPTACLRVINGKVVVPHECRWCEDIERTVRGVRENCQYEVKTALEKFLGDDDA